jgi:hypothetical protein
MPRGAAYFFGGPCNTEGHYIDYRADPPRTLVCKGTTYYYIPGSRGGLAYGTATYRDNYNVSLHVRGERDVFQAFRRLMGTLTHRVAGERRRMDGARHRIKRAVR